MFGSRSKKTQDDDNPKVTRSTMASVLGFVFDDYSRSSTYDEKAASEDDRPKVKFLDGVTMLQCTVEEHDPNPSAQMTASAVSTIASVTSSSSAATTVMGDSVYDPDAASVAGVDMLASVYFERVDKHPDLPGCHDADIYVDEDGRPIYEVRDRGDRSSAHLVSKAYKESRREMAEKGMKKTLCFFKHNPPGSLMSQLEAMAAGFYRYLSPVCVPVVKAVYGQADDGIYTTIGVSSRAIPGFKSLADAGGEIKLADLDDPEIVKGIAIGLTTSYLEFEADLHRRNMDKFGHRIDFDMSCWWLLSKFKNAGISRRYSDEAYKITERDIHEFPIVTDFNPFYWPTKRTALESIPGAETVVGMMSHFPQNNYTEEEVSIFQKLSTNKTFKYYQYRTLLKYLLTDPEMYVNIAKQYIHEKTIVEGVDIIKEVREFKTKHREALRVVLVNMPEFRDFLKTCGQRALAEIIAEFKAQNAHIDKQLAKHVVTSARLAAIKTDVERIRPAYDSIYKAASLETLLLQDGLSASVLDVRGGGGGYVPGRK